MDEAELEKLDISLVKQWCKAEHVNSPDAMAAFDGGRGVFDVSLQARKLDAFISRNALQNQVYRNSVTGLLIKGRVHFAFKSKAN